MSKRVDKQHMQEYLQDMFADKPADEPAEKTLATFCQRYSVTLQECREVYDDLVKKGVIKEEK